MNPRSPPRGRVDARPLRAGRGSPIPPALQAFAAEALGQGDFLFVGAFLVRAGGLQRCGEALEPWLGEEGGQAFFAHLALADVGVAVAAGAEGGGGVVDVDGAG